MMPAGFCTKFCRDCVRRYLKATTKAVQESRCQRGYCDYCASKPEYRLCAEAEHQRQACFLHFGAMLRDSIRAGVENFTVDEAVRLKVKGFGG